MTVRERGPQPIRLHAYVSTRSMSSTRYTRSMASAAWSANASRSRPLVRSEERPGFRCRCRPPRRHRDRCAWAGTGASPPGKRIRSPPGRAIVLPGPLGGRQVCVVEFVLGRIPGLHFDPALLRQQKHHAHLQHERGLIGVWPRARSSSLPTTCELATRRRRALPSSPRGPSLQPFLNRARPPNSKQ